MQTLKSRAFALLPLLALAAAGCSGSNGAPGAAGPQGPAAQGTLSGSVTYFICPSFASDPTCANGTAAGAKAVPATGVTVKLVPDVGVTATTDASGAFSVSVPVGSYGVVLADGSTSFKSLTVPVVNVAATAHTAISPVLVANNPVAVTASQVPNPAGFGVPATVSVNVVGGTAPYSYSYAFVPSAALSNGVPGSAAPAISANGSSATFTTDTFAAVAAAGKVVGLRDAGPKSALPFAAASNAQAMGSPRLGFIGVSWQQLATMTYNLQVTVTDANGFTNQVLLGVPLATRAPATQWVGKGTMVILDTAAATPAWSITSKPSGSAAQLSATNIANPTFIPDADGAYVLSDGTGSLTVVAGDYVGASANCGICHTTSTATVIGGNAVSVLSGIYGEWSGSAHGNHAGTGKTLFQFAMQGGEGNHYAPMCMNCHTVGYNDTPSATNGGFDDLAKQLGWTFPALPASGSFDFWTPMPQQLQYMAGVQCENCHGPLSNHARLAASDPGFTPFTGSRMMAAEVCAQCHDAPPYHDRFPLWSQTWTNPADGSQHGHSNAVTARYSLNYPAYGCTKCHTAQGFNAWFWSSGPNSVQNHPEYYIPPATVATFSNEAEPQTCQTCHDPHTTGLHVDPTQPMYVEAFLTNPGKAPTDPANTASGPAISIQGAGAGEVCMACHQNHTGLRDDQHALTGLAPHHGTQTDVLFGRNVYFMGTNLGVPNAHALITDTCFGCHGKFAKQGVKFAATNHSFLLDASVCGNCHGSTMTAEGLTGTVEAGMTSVKVGILRNAAVAMGTSFTVGAYTAATASAPESTVTSTIVVPRALTAADMDFGAEVHGQPAILLNLPVGSTINGGAATAAVQQLWFQAGSLKDPTNTTPVFGLTTNIAKALWNYSVFETDKSHGAHNPKFVLNVLQATAANLP